MSSKSLKVFFFLVHMIYVRLIDSIRPFSLKKSSTHLKASIVNDVDIKVHKYDDAVEYIKYLLKDGISSASDTPSSVLSDFIGLSADDVIVESLPGGITNYCYMVQLKNNPSKKIFVKHAAEELKAWSNVTLSRDRLRCEYQGMKTFAKYTPQAVRKSCTTTTRGNIFSTSFWMAMYYLKIFLLKVNLMWTVPERWVLSWVDHTHEHTILS